MARGFYRPDLSHTKKFVNHKAKIFKIQGRSTMPEADLEKQVKAAENKLLPTIAPHLQERWNLATNLDDLNQVMEESKKINRCGE